MSNQLISLVKDRVVGSTLRKSVLLNLANKVSDDGTGFWAAKSTIAEEVECSKSSVKATLKNFVSEGLIVPIGRRRCASGYTNEYRLNIDTIRNLPLTEKRKRVIPASSDLEGGRTVPLTGVPEDPQEGHEAAPNHSLTIQEPNCCEFGKQDVEFSQSFLDEFFSACPRVGNRKQTTENLIRAIASGVSEAEIIYGIKAYRKEQQGNDRIYIKYSENWVEQRCWEKFPMRDVGLESEQRELVLRQYQKAITCGNEAIGKHCPPSEAKKLVDHGVVTLKQCWLVGIDL